MRPIIYQGLKPLAIDCRPVGAGEDELWREVGPVKNLGFRWRSRGLRERLVVMPIVLDYRAPDAAGSRIKRVARAAARWSVIGGLAAAISVIVLHPHPLEALPAGPVFLICLLRGGGDWGALTFIWVGGFILYGIYGFAIMLPSRTRYRVAVGVVLAAVHLCSAVLSEMDRRGQL